MEMTLALVEYQEPTEIQVKTRHKEGANHNQRAKQSRRNLPRSDLPIDCRQNPRKMVGMTARGKHIQVFSDTYQDYEEYWRLTTGSMAGILAAASQSYYWNAQRHPSWMAAYQMNTVYLQEMMHSNQ